MQEWLNAVPAFFFWKRDSNDQMRLSGGQSLADGSTAATPLFSSLREENANESRHSDHKSQKSICSFGFYFLNVRLERSNAKISHGEGSHDMGQWEKQLRCLMIWGKYLQK